MSRSLSTIAQEIITDHQSRDKNPPYLRAYVAPMLSLDTLSDRYAQDDAETVVIYAMSNLAHWRGETAARVKRELKVMLHDHNPRRYKMPK